MKEELSFTEYCRIIKQWQQEGFPFIYDDNLRQKIAIFDKKLYSLADKGDTEAIKQCEYLEKLLLQSGNYSNFSLDEYLLTRLSSLKINNEIINFYAQHIKSEQSKFEAPVERLSNYALIDMSQPEDEYNNVQNTVQKILDNILSIDNEPNVTLRKSLSDHPLVFQFRQGDLNACINACITKQNLRPILGVRFPDFNNLPDENLLATIICHELGHWLDFGYRPQECICENGFMQEAFADIIGCQLSKNADYNIEPFIDRVKGFVSYFDDCGLEKYKVCSQKRLNLLNNIFGAKNFHNIKLSTERI